MTDREWTVKLSPELAELLYPPDNHLSLPQRLTAIFSITGSKAFEDVAWTVLGLYRANEMGADAARKCLDRAWKRACPGITRPGYPKGYFSEKTRRPSDKFVAPNPVGPLPAGLFMKNQVMGSYSGPYVYVRGERPFNARMGSLG